MLLELKRIAARNLSRHLVKTILTSLMIMVSAACYIIVDNWLGGIMVESKRNIINYEMGAAKLQMKDYFKQWRDLPYYENFDGWEQYADILDKAGYNTAPEFVFSGTMYSLTGSAPLAIHAVDPDAEKRIFAWPDYIDMGRYIQNGELGLVLGAQTAEKLKVGIPPRPAKDELDDLAAGLQDKADADFVLSCYTRLKGKAKFGETEEMVKAYDENRFTLKSDMSEADMQKLWDILDAGGRNDVRISTSIDYKDGVKSDGSDNVNEPKVRHVYQVIDAHVVGIVNSPDPYTNFNVAYMPLDVLQDEAGMMLDDHITELIIRAKGQTPSDITNKAETKKAILAALGPLPDSLDVYTWEQYSDDMLGITSSKMGGAKMIAILLFFLALIGISNTMLLSILERGKEIGMMRSLGMTNGELIFTYMAEAAMIGLLGSIFGLIVGSLVCIPIVNKGVDFSAFNTLVGGGMGFRVSTNFRGMWNIPTMIGSPVVVMLLSAFMAFLPTRRACHSPITENLRFE